VNSVSANKSICIDMLTVRKGSFDMIAAIDEVNQTMADMQSLGRKSID
jgi:hypothetical protein